MIAYFYTPFRIQWVGLVVAGLYGVIYVLMLRRMDRLADLHAASQNARHMSRVGMDQT